MISTLPVAWGTSLSPLSGVSGYPGELLLMWILDTLTEEHRTFLVTQQEPQLITAHVVNGEKLREESKKSVRDASMIMQRLQLASWVNICWLTAALDSDTLLLLG